MWFEMRREDLSFLEHAPVVHAFEAEIAAPAAAVFAAFADPTTWSAWFPGVQEASYPSGAPYGVGTVRAAHVGATHWVEELIAWDAERRFAYTVTRATVPLAHAQVEAFDFEGGAGGTRVRWRLACEPRLLMRLGAPFAPRVMGGVFHRAIANLEARLGAAGSRG
jgi:carbon monoxide dehydrogenase subunit G